MENEKGSIDGVSISTLDPNSNSDPNETQMTTVAMTPSPTSSSNSSTPSPPPLPPPILKNGAKIRKKEKEEEEFDEIEDENIGNEKMEKEKRKIHVAKVRNIQNFFHTSKFLIMSRYHTTTTVVETTEYITNDGPAVRIEFPRLDCDYIRTIGGILKCCCIILCFFTMIFVMMGPAFHESISWVTFVASIGLFFTSVLLVLYLFRVVDTFPKINWIVIEMVYCFTWTVFFFIAACICASLAYQNQKHSTFAFAAACFFAFGAMIAYGLDCYLKFLSWRHNEKATGGPNPIVIQQQRRSTNDYV
ncbi:unnamed protein product [Caenorhabditis angaria]|uniref:MARVEL domain-containing protein n=1 Tax=Caenorhabditis angaria TaxID=860376 RepID=A0A9P1I6I9_9PELO|nr:unnamed protein product [Caenorhabditis angaria]